MGAPRGDAASRSTPLSLRLSARVRRAPLLSRVRRAHRGGLEGAPRQVAVGGQRTDQHLPLLRGLDRAPLVGALSRALLHGAEVSQGLRAAELEGSQGGSSSLPSARRVGLTQKRRGPQKKGPSEAWRGATTHPPTNTRPGGGGCCRPQGCGRTAREAFRATAAPARTHWKAKPAASNSPQQRKGGIRQTQPLSLADTPFCPLFQLSPYSTPVVAKTVTRTSTRSFAA